MPAQGNPEAVTIAAHVLAESGEALMAGDADRFAAHFELPQTVATRDGARLLRDRDELVQVFDGVCEHFRDIGVTRLEREVKTALFDGPQRIRHAHVSRLYGAEGLLRQPYHSTTLLRCGPDGSWRVSDATHTLHEDGAQSRVLLSAGVSEDSSAELASPAMAVFQASLDRVTGAFMKRDFDALRQAVKLPLFLQGAETSVVFAETAQLRTHFDQFVKRLDGLAVTEILRVVKSAELVGAERMHGTYRTHVLSGDRVVLPSYTSAVLLEQDETRTWRATTIMHAKEDLTLTRYLGIGASAH